MRLIISDLAGEDLYRFIPGLINGAKVVQDPEGERKG